jgi:hypothetical protein
VSQENSSLIEKLILITFPPFSSAYENDYDMSSIGDLLVRRGAEMVSARLQSRQQPELIHGWLGLAILILTGFAFVFMIFWVSIVSLG